MLFKKLTERLQLRRLISTLSMIHDLNWGEIYVLLDTERL